MRVAAGAGSDATGGGDGVNLLLGGLEANLRCSMRNRKGCAWLKGGGGYAQILSLGSQFCEFGSAMAAVLFFDDAGSEKKCGRINDAGKRPQ